MRQRPHDDRGCHPFVAVLRAVAVWLVVLGTAAAQDLPEEFGAGPDGLMTQAQQILESAQSTTEELEVARGGLAELRSALANIVDAGSVEARALTAQLRALGPAPTGDKREAPSIATRRAELEDAIAAANAPILKAEERLHRSEVLIREMDARMRAEQTRRILTRGPSPVLPKHWLSAGQDLRRYFSTLRGEVEIGLDDPEKVRQFQGTLPVSAILIVVGIAVIVLSRLLVLDRVQRWAVTSPTRVRRWSMIVLANALRLVLPALGAIAIASGILALNIAPYSARNLPAGLLFIGVVLTLAHWLGHTLFSPRNSDLRMLALDDREAWLGLRLCQGLGLMLAVSGTIMLATQDYPFRQETISITTLPVVVVTSLLLWRLAGLLRQGRAITTSDGETEPQSEQLDAGFLTFLARLMRVSAAVAPALALVGYVRLGQEALNSMVATVALLGFGLFLYHVVIAVAEAVSDQRHAPGVPPLLPIGIVALLGIACLPLLALIWGARTTDIAEAWRLLLNGVELGDVRLSFDAVIRLVAVLAFGILLTRWIQRLLRLSVMPRTRLDRGAQTAIVTGLGYIGIVATVVAAIAAAGLNLSNLAVVVGALSVGIGFGLQTIVSNFVAGIILLIERPIKEGDWIEVSGYSGFVRKIAVRSTRIETFDRHDVIIPNQDLIAGTVENMTLTTQTGRVIVPVGVAYGSDLGETIKILKHAAEMNGQVLSYPEPQVLFMGLGESSLNFELRCFLRDIGQILVVRSELLIAIYTELGEAGIEIPFPQRDIHIRDLDRLVEHLGGRKQNPPDTKATE